jgi:hypothetical protein
MPSITSQSINDGTTAQTYAPVNTVGNTVRFSSSEADSSAGMPTLDVTFDPRSARRATDRISIRLAVPYEETVDSSPLVRHVSRAEVSIVLPEAVPASERTRVANLIKNALALADVQTAISTPEAFY